LAKGTKVLIECDENEHGLVCRLVGDLEDVAVSQFREALARSSGKKRVIFEFSGLRFVSSTGLSALIRAIRCVHETGGTAAICAATPRVKVWLQIIGLPRAVNVFDSVSTAQAYLLPSAYA
jgi:anti-anti-sigma factor